MNDAGTERAQQELRRVRQWAAIGTVLGMLVAYPVLITVKLAGHLPPHFTWFKLIIAPILLFGLVVAAVWFPERIERWKSPRIE